MRNSKADVCQVISSSKYSNARAFQAYLWTMERNLDIDLDSQEASANGDKAEEEERKSSGMGRRNRRHSLANFLHLK